ncbi:MAG TPA: alpha/beta hydrolase, partial [Actinomycetospora sp.]|nr:alpha/beta hydrolase [Actinomycetospora sp.]
DRADFLARADELGDTPVLLVTGEEDEPEFREPAAALAERLGDRGEHVSIPGMGHALAEEPGLEPAPQTPHAAEVDAHAVAWFRQHLGA